MLAILVEANEVDRKQFELIAPECPIVRRCPVLSLSMAEDAFVAESACAWSTGGCCSLESKEDGPTPAWSAFEDSSTDELTSIAPSFLLNPLSSTPAPQRAQLEVARGNTTHRVWSQSVHVRTDEDPRDRSTRGGGICSIEERRPNTAEPSEPSRTKPRPSQPVFLACRDILNEFPLVRVWLLSPCQ